jgi:hypothetical protein
MLLSAVLAFPAQDAERTVTNQKPALLLNAVNAKNYIPKVLTTPMATATVPQVLEHFSATSAG